MSGDGLPAVGTHEVEAEIYHSWDLCSASRLHVLLTRSAHRCRYLIDSPRDATPAMSLGTAAHRAILEPDEFERRYLVAGQCEATTGKGERCRSQGSLYVDGSWFCKVRGHARAEPDPTDGYTIIEREWHEKALAIRDAVYRHPVAAALLKGQTRREVSMVWRDETHGLDCKGRLDILADVTLADVKVSKDAHPDRFDVFLRNSGAYRQAAFYLGGLGALGREVRDSALILVEPDPPHEVVIRTVEEDWLRIGRAQLYRGMTLYAECLRSGKWPGYPRGIVPSDPPPQWLLRQEFPEEMQ